ncbi:MAG TPA: hypothetical protein VD971_00360 [Phycisphaerales bacterium]|nr:hypothetical protein [Phycisphaerales bacterium]
MHQRAHKDRSRAAFRAVTAGLASLSLALLIWSKLRLVTGIPKTALAEPGERPPPPAPGGMQRHTPPAPAAAADGHESR